MSRDSSPQFTLSMAVIGPRARGRNYGVLSQSPELRLSPSATALLNEFSLALADWADHQFPRFAAFFPLDAEHSALVLAKQLGQTDQGAVAIAACAIVPDAVLQQLNGGAHRLLSALPEPDSPGLGDAPIRVAAAPAPASADGPFTDSGAGWRDMRFVIGRGDPTAALASIIDSVRPVSQQRRFTGWSTTASLPQIGRFAPAELFRLVAHAPADAVTAGDLPHAVAGVQTTVVEGEPVAPPPAFIAWEVVTGLTTDDPELKRALGAARWEVSYAAREPATAATAALLDACVELDQGRRRRLLHLTADAALKVGPNLRAALDTALAQVAEYIVESDGAPQAIAASIGALLDGPMASLPQVQATFVRLAARPDVIESLGAPHVQALIGFGLLGRLAGAAGLGQLTAAPRRQLIEAALGQADNDEAARRLAEQLVADAAAAGDPGPNFTIRAIVNLLQMSPEGATSELATRAIVDLMPDEGLGLLSARSVRPSLRGPDARLEALDAALRLEARLGPAR